MLLCRALPIFFFMFFEFQKVIKSEIGGEYAGESFPKKYLEPEDYKASLKDLFIYVESLARTVDFFYSDLNFTDVNKSLGIFFMQGVLRRALLESRDKIPRSIVDVIQDVCDKADEIISHYVYDVMHGPEKAQPYYEEYRVAQLFKETEHITHGIADFNRNRLEKWILNSGKIHGYVKEMDTGTLPKEKYVELVDDSYVVYYMVISDSDECFSRIPFNLSPPPRTIEFTPCHPDVYCHSCLHASPSISYGLSHRMLNLMMYRAMRRCYWVSPEHDKLHLDVLCSFMYREVVYLARRGYFARDLYLEHIALCGLLGYEEFFRQHWFRKAVSWIDKDGCIQENYNFSVNRTRRFIKEFPHEIDRKQLLRNLKAFSVNGCHNHPMSLLVTVLANAVRYTAHMLQVDQDP